MRMVVMVAQRMAPSQLQPRHISSPVAIPRRCSCDPVQVLGRPCLIREDVIMSSLTNGVYYDPPVSGVLSQPLPRQLIVVKMESEERE